MKINTIKTKLLTAGFHPNEKQLAVFDTKTLEEFDQFNYLGFIITATDQGKEDMLNHISNVLTTFN